ncbi:MAG TPA: hypothetical protein VGE11_07620 [Pseudonocardia sp.]
MKANATPGDDEADGGGAAPAAPAPADPAAAAAVPDLPFVDGTELSAAELRAQVEALDDAGFDSAALAEVEELRAEVAETVGELAKRVDVPARLQAQRDQAAAVIRQGTRSPAALVLAGIGVLLVLVAAVRRRRRS